MDWTTPIDAYCERSGAGLWAEPLNAVSNLAFFASAAYGVRLARRTATPDAAILVLAGLAAAIGAGSLLFHTVATRAAMLADVIPIAVFILVAFGLVVVRLLGLTGGRAAAAIAGFVALMAVLPRFAAPVMGSSAGYAPALAALAAIGTALTVLGRPGGRWLVVAAAVFAVSIGFRMADLPLCGQLSVGTHFGWHLLNAVVLALVMRSLVRP